MVIKHLKRWARSKQRSLAKKIRKRKGAFGVIVLALGLSLIMNTMMQPEYKLHATELLDTIAKAESKSNYNAYFGNPSNTSISFTSMTVGEVLAWQQRYVEQGSLSSAVGRYQFIDSTLRGLVQQLGIDESTLFDEALQDRLAVALLERRGIYDYADNKISQEDFAHNLSKEWAGLPKAVGDNPEQSYYSGDGLNKAQVSVTEVLASISRVRKVE